MAPLVDAETTEATMIIKNILVGRRGNVVTIEPTANLTAAIKLLAERRIGAVVILGADRLAPFPLCFGASGLYLNGVRMPVLGTWLSSYFRYLHFANDLARLIHNADAGLLDRYV